MYTYKITERVGFLLLSLLPLLVIDYQASMMIIYFVYVETVPLCLMSKIIP